MAYEKVVGKINTEDNAPCQKSVAIMIKVNEIGFELLPKLTYSPYLDPSYYRHFADLKKMLLGNRFTSDDEVIAATEAHFHLKKKINNNFLNMESKS